MLLGVVAVFFVCNLLPLIINIIETFTVAINFNIAYLIEASNLLVTINSSVNFIIYVIFGEKFQRLFLMLFCNNSIFGNGRESPDGATHDDSFMSNGDRQSLRWVCNIVLLKKLENISYEFSILIIYSTYYLEYDQQFAWVVEFHEIVEYYSKICFKKILKHFWVFFISDLNVCVSFQWE